MYGTEWDTEYLEHGKVFRRNGLRKVGCSLQYGNILAMKNVKYGMHKGFSSLPTPL